MGLLRTLHACAPGAEADTDAGPFGTYTSRDHLNEMVYQTCRTLVVPGPKTSRTRSCNLAVLLLSPDRYTTDRLKRSLF